MVKKDRNSQPKQDIKLRHAKSNKTRNKQMFTQLKTHQQNKINKYNRMGNPTSSINPEMQMEVDENSQEMDLQLNNKQSQNIQELREVVNNLLLKNKISAKNAFEVPLINLENLQQFESKISQYENGWRKISSTLQNDSKIYSYRVDAIHSIAYKIMNTMTRNKDEEQKSKEGEENIMKMENEEQRRVIPIVEEEDYKVSVHLEKNMQNINMEELNKLFELNPTYQRTRRRFDQTGLSGMLLNNIQIDSNLQLSLNQMRKVKPAGFYSEAMRVQVNKLTQNLNIFKNIENTRKDISEITKQQFIPSSGYEQSWSRIINGQFAYEKEQNQQIGNEMEQEIQESKVQTSFKKVEQAIKFKNKNKNNNKGITDMAQDGLTWLSQMDKKMLGIKSQPQAQTALKRNSSVRLQRNEDDIDFDTHITLSRNLIFSQSTTEKQKQEFNEEIQEKHLLPIRLFNKFKVQQIMTLRQEPPEILFKNYEDQQFQPQFQQNLCLQQVDVKRQQISIRQSKQKLKGLMAKQSTDFKTLCKKFQIAEKNIAPQLCFLTILHLANQNNLLLKQIDQSNFKIIKS